MSKGETPLMRTVFMDKIKERFGQVSTWSTIEGNIAILCSEMPNPITIKKKHEFINQIKKIKDYLIEKEIDSKELKFLDDEIKIHEETKIISLYEERDDSLPQELIDAYSGIAPTTEGILSIQNQLNYAQLARLTDGVYKKTGLIKFFISNEKIMNGKIIAGIYVHPQNILMATLLESKKKEKETGESIYKGVRLFGQTIAKTENNILKEIHLPLYVYRFISNTNKDYVVFSQDKIDVGDYTLTGVETECSDMRALTESAKLPTKLPYFFIQRAQSRIIKFKNHEEFSEKIKSLNIDPKNFFEHPFCFTKKKVSRRLLHPKWYKWMIWAWLTHEPKGSANTYPMHIIQSADMNSGKSLMLNSLHSRSSESSSVFSGSSSTLKNLIPSFRHNPAKLGYLAESNRFSYCDEFLRCVMKSNAAQNGGNREESVGTMNDLLEHQEREAGSGNSSVDIKMTSRIFATTNPVRGTTNMHSLLKSLDGSFLSRWLIYFQTPEHLKMIRESRDSKLELIEYNLDNNDWVSILDYLHSFSAKYDENICNEIHDLYKGIFSEDINNHYDSRHDHHIECLIDGIVKTRCLINNDMKFEAIEEDYNVLKKIWSMIVGSWMTPEMIKKTPKTEKINLMPEACQFLYWKVFNLGQEIEYTVLSEMVKEDLSGQEFVDTYMYLKNSELLLQVLGKVQTYDFFKAKSEENEKIAGQREI